MSSAPSATNLSILENLQKGVIIQSAQYGTYWFRIFLIDAHWWQLRCEFAGDDAPEGLSFNFRHQNLLDEGNSIIREAAQRLVMELNYHRNTLPSEAGWTKEEFRIARFVCSPNGITNWPEGLLFFHNRSALCTWVPISLTELAAI